MNLQELFETYRPFHEEMAVNFSVYKGDSRKIDKEQQHLVALFAVFVFRKRGQREGEDEMVAVEGSTSRPHLNTHSQPSRPPPLPR